MSSFDSADENDITPMRQRFRGFLPVVIDVETGGFNARTDALLEIAAVTLRINEQGDIERKSTYHFHVTPFDGSNIEKASLEVNGIDPHHPLRPALDEREVLTRIFKEVRREVSEQGCTRAVLVGHNAHFDLGFVNAAIERAGIKRNPFHPFSVFDTVTLAGIGLGQTVLSRAIDTAGMEWDSNEAHSARYDTERTADLFCLLVNRMRSVFELSVLEHEEMK